jgi:hypothetical protein
LVTTCSICFELSRTTSLASIAGPVNIKKRTALQAPRPPSDVLRGGASSIGSRALSLAPRGGDRLAPGDKLSRRSLCLVSERGGCLAPSAPGPNSFRPNFELVKKKLRKGDVSAHTAPIYIYTKKKTNYFVRFASPLRCRVFPASYISAVDIFFVGFSAATACSHCVHIASFLHDFDCLATSCLQHRVRSLPIQD